MPEFEPASEDSSAPSDLDELLDDPLAPSPDAPRAQRAGTVALVGRPNAGKSTLMNQLLEEKLAIVSSKPQTTRNRLVGILSEPRGQIVFYDTPGVHKPQHQMNRQMIKAAQEALNDADVVVLLVDAAEPHGKGDAYMLEWLDKVEAPKIVLLNKVDRLRKDLLLPRIALYAETGAFEEIVPVSALKADGTDVVLDLLFERLPEQPPLYDPELLTVHPERFLAAERIREKVLERTGDELPFATAVVIDQWDQKGDNLIVIHASILTERAGQKKILIGSGGRTIKAIGAAARHDLEEYLESRVFLDLNVKVERDWRENRRVLSELDRAPFDVSFE
ncbi:MAG: GTPase Era [Acidobacteriota bacterium]